MKTKIKIIASFMLLFTLINHSVFSKNEIRDEGNKKDFSFIQQYKVSEPLSLDLSTSGGNIRVTSTQGNTVEVAFIVARRGQVMDISLEELRKLADLEIVSTQSNIKIHVIRVHDRSISIGFSVKTPVKSSASLRTSGGNIAVAGLNGTQLVKTSGGNLHLESLSGRVDAKTSGGNIHISESKAEFNASTSGGNILLNNIEGHLEVATSGGNIKAENISEGLVAKTSGGSINLTNVQNNVEVGTSGGSINMNEVSGSIKANTSGGNIKANISKLSGILDLRTSGGSIHATIPLRLGLDLDIKADRINTSLSNFSGTSKKDRVLGQMNGGGIPVKLSTSGGNISLDFE